MRRHSDLLPRDKHDVLSVASLSKLDPDALSPLVPELLNWLQDLNWPVAMPLVPILAKCDDLLAPHIKDVLTSSDPIWKYSLLCALVPILSIKTKCALREDLERLSLAPTDSERIEEVHLMALDILNSINNDAT